MTTGNIDDLLAAFARAYRKHEEEDAKLYPARMAAEGRIGAWLGHDREFKEVVVLVKAYLRERGYKMVAARTPAVGDTALPRGDADKAVEAIPGGQKV